MLHYVMLSYVVFPSCGYHQHVVSKTNTALGQVSTEPVDFFGGLAKHAAIWSLSFHALGFQKPVF